MAQSGGAWQGRLIFFGEICNLVHHRFESGSLPRVVVFLTERHSSFFHQRGCQSRSGGTVQSHAEGFNVPLFHRGQHLEVRRHPPRLGGWVKCRPSSQHWHGPSRRDGGQRRSGVIPTVRPKSFAAKGLRAVEQTGATLQERVFAPMDGGSVCCATRGAGGSHHVQNQRNGWRAPARHVLRRGSAKSHCGWRIDKVLKRRGKQALVRWKGWLAKYDSWIPSSHLKAWKSSM